MASEHPGIQLFLSNRLEKLADALVQQLADSPGHPMKPDTILIQNRGMARWLNLRKADLTGIQMNTRYVYPRALIEELLSGAFENTVPGNQSPYAQEALFWRIYKALPRWSKQPKAYSLKRYLDSRNKETAFLRRYQLASKIAQHIDQLQTYRPDLLRSWAKQNEPEDWRAIIWKGLNENIGESSPPDLFKAFDGAIAKWKQAPSTWPDQLHLFAISSLPPVYLDLLQSASRWIPVHIYLTQPSPLYWGDQLSKKKLLKSKQAIETPGHGLLGNLGRQGQEFLNNLIDAEVFTRDESEFFESPSQAQLLHQLQSDLYELASPKSPKQASDPTGIAVKVCHSERREIEVLKDTLLKRFQEDKSLKPNEVVIMAPNIEDYAASIRSVFGPAKNPKAVLPYSIADYSSRSSSSVAHALIACFDLLQSRFTANGVMNFVSIPAISESFGFSQDDWNVLRTWIEDTGIKWGIDGQHRESATGSFFDAYAWQQGIDRLVSGYCVHPNEDSDWDQQLPHPDMEGSSLELLNRFLELWQFLKGHQQRVSQSMRISTWLDTIHEMIAFLFTRHETQFEESQALFDLLATLKQEIDISEADESCDLKVIRSILEDRLEKDIQAGSFFTGSITFCSMMPMRNVPAKFIGLIGMSEAAYPRQDLKTEFNQFPDGSRAGDRSKREDDRYLFLESILAARDSFYLSYTGIDSQTLNEEPASIVVEELLDTLDDYYHFPENASAREALVSKESLQAFNPGNFDAHAPASFSSEDLEAAKALIASKIESTGLDIQSINSNAEYPDSISWDTFLHFFLNPSRYWLAERLGTHFPYQAHKLEDSEPIEPSHLQDYKWGDTIINDPEILSGKREYKLESILPVGTLGKLTYERLALQVRDLVERWNEIPSGVSQSAPIDLQLEALHLSGRIPGASDRNLKYMRFGNIRSTDLLSGWIQHLLLCQSQPIEKFETHLIGRDASYTFKHSDNASEHLLALKELFFNGHKSALPFFLNTSYLFAKASLKPSSRSKKTPQEIASSEFTKYREYPFLIQGEAYNPYHQLCFPDPEEALGDPFKKAALTVFTPAIEHLEGGLP